MNKKKLLFCAIALVLIVIVANGNSIAKLCVPQQRAVTKYNMPISIAQNDIYAALTDSQYASDIQETMMLSGWVLAVGKGNADIKARVVMYNEKTSYCSDYMPLTSNAQAKVLFKDSVSDDKISFNILLSTLGVKNGIYDMYVEVQCADEPPCHVKLWQSYKKNGINMELATFAKNTAAVDAKIDETIECAITEQSDISGGIPIMGWAYYSDKTRAQQILAELTFDDGSTLYYELAQISSLDVAANAGKAELLNTAINTRIPKDNLPKGSIKLRLVLLKDEEYTKSRVVAQFINN
ncbi:MAG: hypothetical protein RR424_02800 [Oscillospiraceae bacterium]